MSQPRSQRGLFRHDRGHCRTMIPGFQRRSRFGLLGSVRHDSLWYGSSAFGSMWADSVFDLTPLPAQTGTGGALRGLPVPVLSGSRCRYPQTLPAGHPGAAAGSGPVTGGAMPVSAFTSQPGARGPFPGAAPRFPYPNPAVSAGPSPPGASGPRPPCRKRRKSRTAFTAQQLRELEQRFRRQRYLSPVDRDALAAPLALSAAQVITWFQNRRAKLKRDLEELRADVASLQALPPAALHSDSLGSVQAE
uniref:Ladybird homeobox 2 n=1 Tax=Ficedula albicollis TaxID=59894 RepID=A0A803W2H4_FICAL